MSKYTTELRYIYLTENDFNSEMDSTVYTLNNENHRVFLNNYIYNHFYFREIAYETPALFKKFLKRKMHEIMVLYDQRLKSVDLEYDPLSNVDLTESYTHSITDTTKVTNQNNTTSSGTTENTQNNDNVTAVQDTPQTELTKEDIQANKYLSSTQHDQSELSNNTTDNSTEEVSGETNSQGSKSENYTRRETGSSAGYTMAQMVIQWRKVFINVYAEICDELEPCFYQLW